LFVPTQHTKPVDFHSWRRAFNQALADAGVNAQSAAALAGHASLEAHSKYLKNTAASRQVPEGALPKLGAFVPSSAADILGNALFSREKVVEAPGVEPGSGSDPRWPLRA